MTQTLNPTANTNPDPGQGGSAVANATNTGHDASTVSSSTPATVTKSCKWSGFASAPPG